MGKPPQIGVNLSIQKIQQRLAEVNSEAMVLLHDTAHRIEEQLGNDMREIVEKYETLRKQNAGLQKQNEDLKKQNEDIKAKLERMLSRALLVGFLELTNRLVMHKEEKDKALAEIRKRQEMLKHYLGLKQDDIHTDIHQFQASLTRAFGNENNWPARIPRRYLQMTAGLLESEDVYSKWRTARRSQLLLLCGTTPPEALMNRSTHSWLSAGALHLAKTLTADHQAVAYFWCHPEDHCEQVSLKNIVANIISQILSHHPDSLKDTASDFELLLTRMKSDHDAKVTLEPLKEVLRSQRENTTVYIIVDRFEHCYGEMRLATFRILLRIMEELKCIAKVFITIDPTYWVWNDEDEWRYDKKKLLEMEEESGGRMLCKFDWEQPRDPTKW